MSRSIKFTIEKGSVKARNVIALAAKLRSGAGPHTSKKYSRKVKHKNHQSE